MKPFESNRNNGRSDGYDSEGSSMDRDFVVTLGQASGARGSPLAIDFAGIIAPRPPYASQDEDPRPTRPTRRTTTGARREHFFSENHSQSTDPSRNSGQGVLGESTLDLVLEKLYPSPESGRMVINNYNRHERTAADSRRKAAGGKGGYDFHRRQEKVARQSCDQGHADGPAPLERGDSTSTTPNPPSLHEDRHYIPLGAFRMTSRGLPQNSDNRDVESMMDSVVSYSGMEIIEARLVPNQSDADDESCARAPVPPNYSCSVADGTMMTQATSATPFTVSPLVEALPLDEITPATAFFRARKVQCILSILCIVFVVLALGTAYGVRVAISPSLTTETNTSAIDFVPTSPPTTQGDLNLAYFVQVALPESTRSSLKQENSPQSNALRWLRNNTFLEDYTLSRRLQRFALATFYFSTSGERRWARRDGWLSDENECSWYAAGDDTNDTDLLNFRCDGLDEEMKRLRLSGNSLRGTLPLELSLLTSLEVIELSQNLLTGFIPTSLGNMSALREVYLFDNFLSGSIPREMGDVTTLEILDVEYNVLAQMIPETLGELTNLRELRLARNALHGALPEEFGKLSLLEVLHLYSNDLSGTIPNSFEGLSRLETVRWETNRLSGSIPPAIGKWRQVKELNLGNNTLSGTIPSDIGDLTLLTYLDLFGNSLSGSLPTALGRLTNMDRLYLEMNLLSGTIPTQLGKLKSAARLWMFGNELTGSLPSELHDMTSLVQLDISYNKLSGEMPTELGLLTSLEIISLENNDLTGHIPSSLGLISGLQLLALHENDFSGVVESEICLLRVFGELSSVSVDCNKVVCVCCRCS